jgi:aminoglycoside 6-adenylyltransferase
MRREQEMLKLILDMAREDDRIRAVIMNGSRVNPDVQPDIFQDFDIVYVVTDVDSFKKDRTWIEGFGEIMMQQMPEEMEEPPPANNGRFIYLMLFTDGNRIDLTLFPIARLDALQNESLSVLLLDKDDIIEPFPVPNDRDYLPNPPSFKAFSDCCNEFWWVCTYVAKGLWREEITYAKYMMDQIVRGELMRMLVWHVGMKTEFLQSPGKLGKYFKRYLEPELWSMLETTYSDADYDTTWDALFMMCDLFRISANQVAGHFSFDYPADDDARVTAHLHHVRHLSSDAKQMY